ncbi:uncharacterized protein LOC106666767 [Cimex lectularius]|uniref:Sequestosome-1 n=1 Tax=Cimex lectularius TaxID=79782 RepID=A0A8I6RTZ5_CIMLE|nr:uncharacterized protein LOC106666767 [Cimex lectularius]
MSLENAVLFKVYLVLPGEETQIRKFSIDRDVVTNFLYVKQKISALFPLLQNIELEIFWTDDDDDNIQICNDEELMIALTELQGVYKKIIVKPSAYQNLDLFKKKVNEDLHAGVECDACNKSVIGFRYKCVLCPDYDLCSECEQKQMHKEHVMFRLPFPIGITPFSRHRINKEINRFGKAFDKMAHGVRNWSHHGREKRQTRLRESLCPLTENPTFSENQQKEGTTPEETFNLVSLLQSVFNIDKETKFGEELCDIAKKINIIIKASEKDAPDKETEPTPTTFKKTEPTAPTTSGTGNDQLFNKSASTSDIKTSTACEMETEDGWALIKKECKIDEALKLMLSMGFSNEGGWLREMLIQTDGDIRKVIDKMMAINIF